EAGDVDELDLGLDRLRALGDARDAVKPLVGDRDAADVRFDRAKGKVRRLRRRSLGQRIEKRGFADVWQADDAAAKAHVISRSNRHCERSEAIQPDRHVAALLAMTESRAGM